MKRRWIRWTLCVVAAVAALVAIRVTLAFLAPPPRVDPPVAMHGGDVYGDPLPEGAVARLGTIRFRGKGPAVWAPDGEHLLVGGWNDEILAMNAKTGLVDWTLPGHSTPFMRNIDVTDLDEMWRVIRRGEIPLEDDTLTGLTMFPDGKRLLSQGYSLRVWDLASRTELKVVPLRGGNAWGGRISPDGSLVACPCGEWIRMVDLVAGKERRMQRVGSDKFGVNCVAWSADGARVFAGLADGHVAVVLKRGGTPVSFPLSDVAIDALLVADEGRALWTLDHKGALTIRSLTSPNVAPRRIDLGVDDDPKKQWWRGTLVASPDGRVVAASSNANDARWIDVATAKFVEGPNLGAGSSPVGWSPDGRRFAAWRWGDVRISGDDVPPQPDTIVDEVEAMAWSPDGTRVATASSRWMFESEISAWDAQTGRRLWTIKGDSSMRSRSIAWTADGAQIVASVPSRIVGLDAATGARLWTYDVSMKKPGWPILESRGAGTIWMDEARDLHFVDLRGGPHEVGVSHLGIKPERDVEGMTPLPDLSGAVLLENVHADPSADGKSWTSRPRVRLWRIGASAPAAEVAAAAFGGLAASRDGRFAAFGDTPIVVLDLSATPPREVGRVGVPQRGGPHGRQAYTGAFSGDGSLFAVGDDLGTIHVYALPSLAEVKTFRGHRAQVTSLAFSDDGARLVSGSADATALVWSLR